MNGENLKDQEQKNWIEGEGERNSSEGDNEIKTYEGFEQASNEIRDLARTVSRVSTKSAQDSYNLSRYLSNMSAVPGETPFDSTNPKLDPNSDDFDAKFWVKNLRKLQDSDEEYYHPENLSMAFRNLRASGLASDADYQPTVLEGWWKYSMDLLRFLKKDDESQYFDILKTMDAYIRAGELTVVLGRPGSGCSTFLKTVAANTYGYKIDKNSKISYDGISQKEIQNRFRGNVIYAAEVDKHFPNLTVSDTLEFVAALKAPMNRGHVDRDTYAKHLSDVTMATYGLSHTRHTRVGNEFIRGVSGGERKRVTIAEASLSGTNIQCWDNATRGLDAATALEFIRALRTSSKILQTACLVAIYQCSEDAYNLFDRTIVLYEGYQIYNGKANEAKEYFERMGYECPQRQTTADFLTSLTNPAERVVRKGFESKVPKTPYEFSEYWRNSPEYRKLTGQIDEYMEKVSKEDKGLQFALYQSKRQAKLVPRSLPYIASYPIQLKYLMKRNFLRILHSPSITIQTILSQFIMGLILGSVFYNLQNTTSTFYSRGSALFFSLLFNAFLSLLEILSIFEGRDIVMKHRVFALYHPSAEGLSAVLTEIPSKVLLSMAFNFPVYFMSNLRRDPGRFFFYWLCVFLATMTMSHMFRCMGAIFNTFAQAMTFATTLLLALVLFTGFALPIRSMLGWSRWINYLDPLGYVYESLLSNEFYNRDFECDQFVPQGGNYSNVGAKNRACSTVGSEPGSSTVSGTRYMELNFKYSNAHKWRNFGINIGFLFFFLGLYLLLTELNKGKRQKGEVALYLRSSMRRAMKSKKQQANDLEAGKDTEKYSHHEAIDSNKEKSDSSSNGEIDLSDRQIFHWRNLTYQVKVKGGDRVLLDHVDGWVKPGQVTALMGSSGAGKTTLLNCLCDRVSTGLIVDGARMVNGKSLDSSFQRSIGYCQQQDIHLPLQSIREALRFSALLRQPNYVSKKEKYEHVEYVIDLLEMTEYADALVGEMGEGLNVEQRKRLTIGVELVAKPDLLIFLDEPTSGLDSQTAWSVCKLIRKLADSGQAILCTIHQPSAILLQEFDRLLFLQKGGQTVYFGNLGENCQTLIDYFEKYGAHKCPPLANPAEWMLEVVGAAPGSKANQNYFDVWKNSTEYQEVQRELDRMEQELVKVPKKETPDMHNKYATPIWKQYFIVTGRAFQQTWRSPGYIYSKFFLVVSANIFDGFALFKAGTTSQGLQNQMYSLFMSLIPFNTLVNQIIPNFIQQREVYEVREAPSRTFSWVAFMASQITCEIPYQIVVGTLAFFCWYYPVGFYRNAEPTDQVNGRGVTMWLFLSAFYVYTSTMAHLCLSFNEVAENAGNTAVTLFTMCLLFCGVMAPPSVFPHFWIFMYRCSPFTYLIQGALATGLANTKMTCEENEYVTFEPPEGQSCGKYMSDYIKQAGGFLQDENSTSQCKFCAMSSTNQYLEQLDIKWDQRWRNWGIFICFIAINCLGALFFYWLARVPKGSRRKK